MQEYSTEIIFVSGLALIAIGIGFIYWPAALIFTGLAMAAIAYKLAAASSSEPVVAPTAEAEKEAKVN